MKGYGPFSKSSALQMSVLKVTRAESRVAVPGWPCHTSKQIISTAELGPVVQCRPNAGGPLSLLMIETMRSL